EIGERRQGRAGYDRDQGASRQRADATLVGENGGEPDLAGPRRREGGGAGKGRRPSGRLHERLGVLRARAGAARDPLSHPGDDPVPQKPAQHLGWRLRIVRDRVPDHRRRRPGLRRGFRSLRAVNL
ncbi:MAG: hypothetical protein AVDCRST_MAG80-273, partial [uncultured Rubrobacteraceae bacterium]